MRDKYFYENIDFLGIFFNFNFLSQNIIESNQKATSLNMKLLCHADSNTHF